MPEPQHGTAGYVYILINAAFPEFIKIGLTTLDPKERARQLSVGTGIPAPMPWHGRCMSVTATSWSDWPTKNWPAIEPAIIESSSACRSRTPSKRFQK